MFKEALGATFRDPLTELTRENPETIFGYPEFCGRVGEGMM